MFASADECCVGISYLVDTGDDCFEVGLIGLGSHFSCVSMKGANFVGGIGVAVETFN